MIDNLTRECSFKKIALAEKIRASIIQPIENTKSIEFIIKSCMIFALYNFSLANIMQKWLKINWLVIYKEISKGCIRYAYRQNC